VAPPDTPRIPLCRGGPMSAKGGVRKLSGGDSPAGTSGAGPVAKESKVL
jgi:hypothetical protein